jgi:predicted PurR-regulated permease PerM
MIKTDKKVLTYIVIGASLALVLVLGVLWKPIFWAVVVGLIFSPLYERLARRLSGRRNLAAALAVVAIVTFVIFPALILGSVVVGEAVSLYDEVEISAADVGTFIEDIEQAYMPDVRNWISTASLEGLGERIQSIIADIGGNVLTMVVGAGQGAAIFVLNFSLMLYLLFFILRDGGRMYKAVFDAVPLPADQKARFFDKFAVVAIATLKGTLIVGIVQGSLGGFIFVVLGIEGAIFWGAVMAVISILPAFGAALVWFPAAVILLIGGEWVKGIILILFGTLVISVVDNLLRPILVGHDTKMPDYLVLFSTLGGLSLMGISGFVLGPILAALFLVAWQIYTETHQVPRPQV